MDYIFKKGRPPLPEEVRKSNSVRVRLTDAELEALKNEAVANGVTVSDYIREKINNDRADERG